ncbi:OmpW/AlkL family protein [Aestuariivita boseongensis]|uniref:OmpW/AlkL family protein n=1 Tax=Aestuariivita boseongensis TaxID=1470562 RepID=UPI0006834691|nr:OmpW family outer membrane protein [Aestuariivita boseongensis]
MTKLSALAAGTTALCLLAVPAFAQSQGDWTFGVGAAYVNPKSNNGTLATLPATVDSNTQLSLTFEYFIRDNLGIELLAATPFKHNVTLGGATYAGNVRHLPPTLSLNYHFPTGGNIKPFVGIGVNYTTFFDETSPLGVLKLDDSVGVAVQLGVDFAVSDRGSVRVNARWIDIESDVTLNGAPIGTADIDPVVLGISYVHRF